VTACTDLLKPRGYARAHQYLRQLAVRMGTVGAATIDQFVTRAYGLHERANGVPLASIRLANTEHYVDGLESDRRYAREQNSRAPRKIDRTLKLFDCLSCDICVPLCPNDANFVFLLPRAGIPVVRARQHAGGWFVTREEPLAIAETHQIGTFADFCNECGNCDTFCPEDGGPYRLKPRFFRTHGAWADARGLDGFWLDRRHGCDVVAGRIDRREYRAVVRNGGVSFRGDGFAVRFDAADPERTLRGTARGPVDLTLFYLMDALRASILSWSRVNYINSLH
jgi:putative selenate reductase